MTGWSNGRARRIAIAFVCGTRPELVKAAPLVHALRERPQEWEPLLVVLEQQPALLDLALADCALVPDARCAPADAGATHADRRGALGAAARRALEALRPRVVAVVGDTLSALAGADAAAALHLPCVHLEAGLRSGSRESPFPEECHRIEIARLAWRHYAPSGLAQRQLIAEGVPRESIRVVGNTFADALRSRGLAPGCARPSAPARVLVTLHRQEARGALHERICLGLGDALDAHAALELVFVLHSHPDARSAPERVLRGRSRVTLLEPLPRDEFLRELCSARVVLTDSGGVQEEAAYLGVPALVAREHTERTELLACGASRAVRPQRELVADALLGLLAEPDAPEQGGWTPYARGDASERILADLAVRARGGAAPNRAALHAWLAQGPVVRPDGAVLAWTSPTHPAYVYPEAQALWSALAHTAALEAGARRELVLRAHERCIPPHGGLGKAGVDYAFDAAMALRAFDADARATGVASAASDRAAAFVTDCLRARRATAASTAETTGRWSRSFGCHLIKAAAWLARHARSRGDARVERLALERARELVALQIDGRFRIHAQSDETYAHAHSYALEGLLQPELRELDGARGAVARGADWLVEVQRVDGGIPAWCGPSGAFGPARSDATAQALRVWTVLDRARYAGPIEHALAFLADHQSPAGGVYYEPGSRDEPAWSALFALQALHWLGGEARVDELV